MGVKNIIGGLTLNGVEVATVDHLGGGSIGLEYTLNSTGTEYSVTGIGECTDTEIIIPTRYNKLPVTSIGKKAFVRCSTITSVVIPSSIRRIQENAFSVCDNLVTVFVPASVKYIDPNAFSNCTALKNVVLQEGLESIDFQAFYNCSNLERLVIPKSVTLINGHAFSACNMLTIYCAAEAAPASWSTAWNSENRPVVWGYINDFEGVNNSISEIITQIGDIETALDVIIAIQESLIGGNA